MERRVSGTQEGALAACQGDLLSMDQMATLILRIGVRTRQRFDEDAYPDMLLRLFGSFAWLK